MSGSDAARSLQPVVAVGFESGCDPDDRLLLNNWIKLLEILYLLWSLKYRELSWFSLIV